MLQVDYNIIEPQYTTPSKAKNNVNRNQQKIRVFKKLTQLNEAK